MSDYPPLLWLIFDGRAWTDEDAAAVLEVCKSKREARVHRGRNWPDGRIERLKRISLAPPSYEHEAWED